MRNAFIDELVIQATTNERIALIVGDLGYSVVEPFAEKFPERFINAGVAEQNMMGMAAGMASEGYHVFVYSIANFPTFRCAEQIRNDVAYHNLPVTVVAVGGGLGYGSLGYSHHAIQDYALMRVIPNMMIAAPADPMEVRACIKYLIKNPQPSYLRLGKAGEKCIHSKVPTVTPGKWLEIRSAENRLIEKKAIITTGATLEVASHLSTTEQYRNFALYTLPLWGMEFKKNQQEFLCALDEILIIEDHLLDGGFCSWLLEAMLPLERKPRVTARALNSRVCGMVGTQKELNAIGWSLAG